MTIYTSNYASVKKFPEGLEPIAISVGPPKWFNGTVDKRLAPSWAMMKKPRAEYDRLFANHLSKLDAKKIISELPENAVLLCYEAHNDWCHRRMVAEWLEKELDIEVCEFGFEREQTFPYAECCEANKGKVRNPNKPKPQKEAGPPVKRGFESPVEDMTREEWIESLPSVKARRASMKARPAKDWLQGGDLG
ncbi:DUF488 family protein, N3 subclade [Peribacillus frigoritolerans]|uniref:DUF488 family protein, N3 subclade n=1 Tax=Peribacillus frigoritolerans TaxID=450367 RepID=UPI00207966A3|nr:DUF488 family protein [Peribacillus frigoritolerans]USK77738.1 DUF488 domain-containing protein [Peribacillus frigoritolerans]USK77817.1 DUF488 domain-containing protein [Peribacillus frigoritolerans]USK77853.1 DUF488 domain-containing protein [Peribacillus frigoritolerans]